MDQFSPREPDRHDGGLRALAPVDRNGGAFPPGEGDRDVIDVSEAEGETSGSGQGPDRPSMPAAWIFVAAGIVLLALLAWGIYGHWKTSQAAADFQEQEASMVPSVRVVEAKSEAGPIDVTLPGETQPFTVSNIFARATGYIAERHVDIGSRVKTGDLLVHIAAPDLDQQLAQAIAQLGQVKAALLQAQANVTQAEANLNRPRSTG